MVSIPSFSLTLTSSAFAIIASLKACGVPLDSPLERAVPRPKSVDGERPPSRESATASRPRTAAQRWLKAHLSRVVFGYRKPGGFGPCHPLESSIGNGCLAARLPNRCRPKAASRLVAQHHYDS